MRHSRSSACPTLEEGLGSGEAMCTIGQGGSLVREKCCCCAVRHDVGHHRPTSLLESRRTGSRAGLELVREVPGNGSGSGAKKSPKASVTYFT